MTTASGSGPPADAPFEFKGIGKLLNPEKPTFGAKKGECVETFVTESKGFFELVQEQNPLAPAKALCHMMAMSTLLFAAKVWYNDKKTAGVAYATWNALCIDLVKQFKGPLEKERVGMEFSNYDQGKRSLENYIEYFGALIERGRLVGFESPATFIWITFKTPSRPRSAAVSSR
jgi:hypothetical protein